MLREQDRQKLDGIVSQMEANGEAPEDIQFVVNDFKSKYDTKPQVTAPQETPSLTDALYAKTTQLAQNDPNASLGKQIGAGLYDATTMTGRALTSIPTLLGSLAGGAKLGQAYDEYKKDVANLGPATEGKGINRFAEDALRSPGGVLPGASIVSGVTKLAGKGALTIAGKQGLGALAKQGAKAGLLTSVPMSIGEQGKNVAEGGKVDPLEVAITTGASTALGAGLPVAGAAIAKGVQKLTPNKIRTGIADALQNAASRNLNIELRPGQTGANLGYDAENALKHDITGSVREIAEKSKAKLDELNKQARELGAQSNETVSISDLINTARKSFSQKGNVHDYEKISGLLDELENTYKNAYGSDFISIPDAMDLRTQIGDKTAFVGRRDAMGVKADPDADWKEQVFNKLYGEIKGQLHQKVGPELKVINQAQTEIIPIRQVALRRLPIAESNLRAGLMDAGTAAIGTAAGAMAPGNEGDRTRNALIGGTALALLRRGSGSKAVTKALYGLSEKVRPKSALGKIGGTPINGAETIQGQELSRKVELPKDVKTPTFMRKRFGDENNSSLGAEVTAPKKPILPASEAKALQDDSDPFYSSLLTPKQYRELKAAENFNNRIRNLEEPVYDENVNIDELESPEDFYMRQAYESEPVYAHVPPKENKLVFLNDLKRRLGFNPKTEVNTNNLTPEKEKAIEELAHRINTDEDAWNIYHDNGLLDQPWNPDWSHLQNPAAVHRDDIIQWLNETDTKKNIARELGSISSRRPKKPTLGMISKK